MPSQWYYLKDEKQEGPVSSDELKQLAAAGSLAPEDYIWKEGMEDWVPAKRLKGLPFPGNEKKAAAKSAQKAEPSAKQSSAQKTAAQPKQESAAQPSNADSGLVPLDNAVDDIGLVPLDQATAGNDDLVPLDQADSQDDAVLVEVVVDSDDVVPIDQAVDEPVPIDDAVAIDDAVPIDEAVSDDAVPIDQAVAPVQDDAVPIDQAVAAAPAAASSFAKTALPPYPGLLHSCFLACGAGLLAVAFVAPWWKMTLTPGSVSGVSRSELMKAASEGSRFYYEKTHDRTPRQMTRRKDRLTFWVWGWQVPSGIVALICGVLILASAIVFSLVRALQYWAWIIRFASILPAIAMLVLFLVWLFDVPGDDVDPVFSQGVVLGPYMILVGGLILLVIGIVGGIAGVKQFNHARRLRRGYSY